MRLFLCASLVVLGCSVSAQSVTHEACQARFLNATNYWGVDLKSFRSHVNTNMALMSSLSPSESRELLREWYRILLDLHIPTNGVSDYKCWLQQKARGLSGCSQSILAPECTNLWMRSADFSRELFTSFRRRDEILAEANLKFSENYVSFTNSVRRQRWIWDQNDFQTARERAFDILNFGLVEDIGLRGIPRLPSDVRWTFYSNFVERACLDEGDRSKIRKAIDRVDKPED